MEINISEFIYRLVISLSMWYKSLIQYFKKHLAFFILEDVFSRWKNYRMCPWKKGVFLAGQEGRECCVFISDVGIRVYLSLILATGKFKQLF